MIVSQAGGPDNHKVFKWNGSKWKDVSGSAKNIAIGEQGKPLIVTHNHLIFWPQSCLEKEEIDQARVVYIDGKRRIVGYNENFTTTELINESMDNFNITRGPN